MEGVRLIFVLLVFLALTEYGLGKELFNRELPRQCRDRQIVKRNGKVLKCVGGRFVSCRVRKEFVTGLTYQERVHYITTVKTLVSDQRHKSKFENLLNVHERIRFVDDDFIKYFLPWHRWFTLEYENLLRQIDSQIVIPYWDWSLMGGDPFKSDFWATDDSGFGGNGNPPGECVDTGPFREGEFSLGRSAGGGCLTRNFTCYFPNAVHVRTLLTNTDLIEFESSIDGIFHNEVHNSIGGLMARMDAASAPEFIPHHGFIDKIWSDWQKRGNNETYFQDIEEVLPGTNYFPREMLDLENLPGGICVVYEDPKSVVFEELRGLSFSELRGIPGLPIPTVSKGARDVFHLPPWELQTISRLRKKMQPKHMLRKSQLKGQDAELGFRFRDLKKVRAAAIKSGNFRW